MNPIVLYREVEEWIHEKKAAQKYFPCTNSRVNIKENDLVIGRFSLLPFYKEQDRDIRLLGARIINSYEEHMYLADLGTWYQDLKDYTPETWNDLVSLPEKGPFVLKGQTNSKKFLWNEMMFARNKKEAIEIEGRLFNDSLIHDQKIYIRKYIPLKTFCHSIHSLPITNEFRVFCYRNEILSIGYYWSSHIDDLIEKDIYPDVNDVPRDFLQKIADIINKKATFWVMDVAETENGDWIVIELNDGCQSGLSENNPEILYGNLSEAISLDHMTQLKIEQREILRRDNSY